MGTLSIMKGVVAVALLAWFLATVAYPAAPAVKDGDIIFQTSRSSQSVAIQRATSSRYSHMGVVLFRQGKSYVLEAVDPVGFAPLTNWIARGLGGKYLVMRLKKRDALLTPQAISRMLDLAKPMIGKRYDYFFEWSDDRLYCSELVYKLYEQALSISLCPTRHLGDFNIHDPTVSKKLRERFGTHIPLNEAVVAPSDIIGSPFLVEVAQ